MNPDFHYYATYCAAILAGYNHEESMIICYSDNFTDHCTKTLLSGIGAPLEAATTQLQLEMMSARTDAAGLQDITRIWSSFHFLPYDLYANPKKKCSKRYQKKYRLICNPNGELVKHTVELTKGRSLQAVGVAMHVLADTWAHRYFAGTPSMVINSVPDCFYEQIPDGDGVTWRKMTFRHSVSAVDDLEQGIYTSSLPTSTENSIMNLGHGRAGHLPDYSFMRYRFVPAWGDYEEVRKDNPSEYLHAFCQMIYAMKYIRGESEQFELNQYDWQATEGMQDEIRFILEKRQLDGSADWKALGERLSGHTIEEYDVGKYQKEYVAADPKCKEDTFLGKFIAAALRQKSMVAGKILESGSTLAGRFRRNMGSEKEKQG